MELETASARWVAARLRAGETVWLEHRGASMWPTLRHGDRLRVAPLGPVLRPGDVVVCARAGRLVAHRVTALRATGVVLRGDAIREPDPPLPRAALLGRVAGVSRGGRPRPVSGAPVARLLLVAAGIARLLGSRAGRRSG